VDFVCSSCKVRSSGGSGQAVMGLGSKGHCLSALPWVERSAWGPWESPGHSCWDTQAHSQASHAAPLACAAWLVASKAAGLESGVGQTPLQAALCAWSCCVVLLARDGRAHNRDPQLSAEASRRNGAPAHRDARNFMAPFGLQSSTVLPGEQLPESCPEP